MITFVRHERALCCYLSSLPSPSLISIPDEGLAAFVQGAPDGEKPFWSELFGAGVACVRAGRHACAAASGFPGEALRVLKGKAIAPFGHSRPRRLIPEAWEELR